MRDRGEGADQLRLRDTSLAKTLHSDASLPQNRQGIAANICHAKRRAILGLKYFLTLRSVRFGREDQHDQTAPSEGSKQTEARRLFGQCRWRARHHRRAGALAGRLAGQSDGGADRRPGRAGIRAADRPLARLWRQEPRARVFLRDLHLGCGARCGDRADRPVHDGACAACASALCGEVAGDRRPHQPWPRGAQHRLRLEPEGIRHVRHAAGRERLRPGSRMDRHRRKTLRLRRADRLSTAPTTVSRKRSAVRRACRRHGR